MFESLLNIQIVDHCWSFRIIFFWSLYCMSIFERHLLNIPLVSSNLSHHPLVRLLRVVFCAHCIIFVFVIPRSLRSDDILSIVDMSSNNLCLSVIFLIYLKLQYCCLNDVVPEDRNNNRITIEYLHQDLSTLLDFVGVHIMIQPFEHLQRKTICSFKIKDRLQKSLYNYRLSYKAKHNHPRFNTCECIVFI